MRLSGIPLAFCVLPLHVGRTARKKKEREKEKREKKQEARGEDARKWTGSPASAGLKQQRHTGHVDSRNGREEKRRGNK